MTAKRRDARKSLVGRPLAEGEYTYASSPISLSHITPEQKEWVEKCNEAIGVFNTTGDRTMANKLGISLPER